MKKNNNDSRIIVDKFLFLKKHWIKYILNNTAIIHPYILFMNKFLEKNFILSSIKLCSLFKRKGGSKGFNIYF